MTKSRYLPFLLIIILGLCLLLSIQCNNSSSPPNGTGDPEDTTGIPTEDTTDDTTVNPTGIFDSLIADHRMVAYLYDIPDDVIRQARANLNFFYMHTSHGSQIVTGMGMLEDEDTLYTLPPIHEVSGDLGGSGDTSWASTTREYLGTHSEVNVAFWSWCGGVSDNTADGINAYLNKVAELEGQYPHVKFIYMTGHLDGTGVSGNLYTMNNLIREYCYAHNKILFDFADIESYDPDGTFYPDETDLCSWCATWCNTHTCPSCAECAHSHCFNCYMKGEAFWWLCARMVGWDGSEE